MLDNRGPVIREKPPEQEDARTVAPAATAGAWRLSARSARPAWFSTANGRGGPRVESADWRRLGARRAGLPNLWQWHQSPCGERQRLADNRSILFRPVHRCVWKPGAALLDAQQ